MIIPKLFQASTFDSYTCDTAEQTRLVAYLKEACENGFDRNVIISGGVGIGKTHLAYAIINHLEPFKPFDLNSKTFLISPGKRVYIATVKGIIDAIRDCWGKNPDECSAELLKAVNETPLLIVDEIGIQYGSDSERLELFEVFNKRYNDMLHTVAISNLNREQVSKLLGQRIVDRLYGGAEIFEIKGKSRRT